MSDRVPYLIFTVGPALACLGMYIHYSVQVWKSRRDAGAARRGPVGPYPTIQLAHLTDRQGNSNVYFLSFQLHSIGVPRPGRGSAVAMLACPTCASEITCVIRDAGATRRRRFLWFALSTAAVAVSGVAAGVGAAIFDPEGGAEFLLEPFAVMAAILALAILAQRWQREDGVFLRRQPPRASRLHSLRYQLIG